MDNTLVGNYYDVLNKSKKEILHFNKKAVDVLEAAVIARAQKKVSAILMLTNNSDKHFIEHVHNKLKAKLDVPYVFDYIMDREHEFRPLSDDPPKRLVDVEFMMEHLDKSTYNLSNRVFFFDDIPDHVILTEIPLTHYINIFPPFEPHVQDKTNFKPVLDAISSRGGKPPRRKITRKTRLNRRSSKKNLTNILDDI